MNNDQLLEQEVLVQISAVTEDAKGCLTATKTMITIMTIIHEVTELLNCVYCLDWDFFELPFR